MITFEDIRPLLKNLPPSELTKLADWAISHASHAAFDEEREIRDFPETETSPQNSYERWPGVVTYPNC